VLAALGNDTFVHRLFFLLHILSAIVAFAPTFVWPSVRAAARKGSLALGPLDAIAAKQLNAVHGPALLFTGGAGIVMVLTSAGETFEFSQLWISLAFVLWFALLGVVYGLLAPATKKAGEGDEAAAAKVPMFTGIVHLLAAATLVVMIWKPGL